MAHLRVGIDVDARPFDRPFDRRAWRWSPAVTTQVDSIDGKFARTLAGAGAGAGAKMLRAEGTQVRALVRDLRKANAFADKGAELRVGPLL